MTVIFAAVIFMTGRIIVWIVYPHEMNEFILSAVSFVLGNVFFVCALTLLAYFDLLSFGPVVFWMICVADILFFLRQVNNRKFLPLLRVNTLCVLGIIGGVAVIVLFNDLFRPLDLWDTRAIWMLKAKSFFLEDGFRNVLIQTTYYVENHRAYPNGLPLLLSLLFRLYGNINETASRLFLVIYYLEIVALFVGVLRHFWRRIRNVHIVLLVFVLFLSWKFTQYASSGYADIPLALSFAVSTTCLLLSLNETSPDRLMRLLTISLLSGIQGSNLKNEGTPFFIFLAIGVVSIMSIRWKEVRDVFKKQSRTVALSLSAIGIGMSSDLIWRVTRSVLDVPEDIPLLFRQRTLLTLLKDISLIGRSFLDEFSNSSQWGMLILPIFLVFMSGTLFLSIQRKRRVYAIPAGVISMQLLIYFVTYLFSNRDISWHLLTSLERLVLHLIPSMLCVSVSYARLLIPAKCER